MIYTPNSPTPEIREIDGFGIAAGARFATKAEYEQVTHYGLMFNAITTALAAAADDTGLLARFNLPKWFDEHFVPSLGYEPEDLLTPITYDTVTSMFFTEALMHLVNAGYLAHRGNGDSYDYRLALPATGDTPTDQG